MDRDKIREMTLACSSGQWGLDHVDRLLKLIEIIGAGQIHDGELVWLAVHLHDWGAYEPYVEKGKDHAVRSREVAAEILPQLGLDEKKLRIVLDAISEHNGSGACSSIESTLLRDADYLDFLGFIGIARDFAKGPQDIRKCLEATKKRLKFFDYLLLPKSIEIGRERLREIHTFLERLEAESFGHY